MSLHCSICRLFGTRCTNRKRTEIHFRFNKNTVFYFKELFCEIYQDPHKVYTLVCTTDCSLYVISITCVWLNVSVWNHEFICQPELTLLSLEYFFGYLPSTLKFLEKKCVVKLKTIPERKKMDQNFIWRKWSYFKIFNLVILTYLVLCTLQLIPTSYFQNGFPQRFGKNKEHRVEENGYMQINGRHCLMSPDVDCGRAMMTIHWLCIQ